MLGRKTSPNTSASRSEIPPWNDRSWCYGAQQEVEKSFAPKSLARLFGRHSGLAVPEVLLQLGESVQPDVIALYKKVPRWGDQHVPELTCLCHRRISPPAAVATS